VKNLSSGFRTRHIDTRYHFVREHVVDEFIKFIFVKSDKNAADMFTKNAGKEIYERHIKRFLRKDESSHSILEIGRVLYYITNIHLVLMLELYPSWISE
jgi:hypothetical protein